MARGARAVFQVYPENLAQRELILGFAMCVGFAGGVVVDYPHRYAEDPKYLFILFMRRVILDEMYLSILRLTFS